MADTKSGIAEFVQGKGLIIGIVLILGIAVGFIFLNQEEEAPPAAAAPVATATLSPGETASAEPEPAETGTGPENGTEQPSDGLPAGDTEPGTDQDTETTEESPDGTPPEPMAGTHDQGVTMEEWRPTAEKFAAAWANPEGGKEAWLKRLKPVVTDQLYSSFEYTEPHNIYKDTLKRVVTMESLGYAYDFQGEYEKNGPLFLGRIVAQPDGSWLVDGVTSP